MHNHPQSGCGETSCRGARAEKSILSLLGDLRGLQLDAVAASCFLGPHAPHLAAELDDDAVMYHAVDGGCRGQGILKDLIPFREDQIGGDDHAAAFVPLGQKGEQHLHFLPALLDVSQVIQDDDLEAVQATQLALQFVISFGAQQPSDQLEGGDEQDTVVALHPFVAQPGDQVSFDSSIDIPPLGKTFSVT